MAVSADINRKVQIVRDVTPGTYNADGNHYQLQVSKLELQPDGAFDTFKASGDRFLSVSNQITELAKLTLSGRADFIDLFFWLSGALCLPVTTRLIPSTGLAYRHMFEPSPNSPNTRAVYSVLIGDSTYAERTSNVVMTALGLKLPRLAAQEISGGALGGDVKNSVSDGVTMHSSPIILPKAPIAATDFAAYIVDTPGDLGTAAMIPIPFNMEWMLDALAGAVFGYNRSLSFSETVETDPKGTAKLKVPVNATTAGWRTSMRNGAMKYLRLQALGRTIETSNEVQGLTISGSPTGGTYTLTYAGQTTAGIAYNANAAAIQAALEALSNLAPGDVVVAGSGPFTITFGGTLAGQDASLIVGNGASLTGGTSPAATVVETTVGGGREELTIDTAVFITSQPSRGPEQGALSYEYGFEWATDPTWGGGTKVKLVNTFAGWA